MENEKDFVEREFPDFGGGFGDLPEDLRSTNVIPICDGRTIPPIEADSYARFGGSDRVNLEAVPGSLAGPITFEAINYLPRANFPSFRSQRFFLGGTALLPPNPTAFVDLGVNTATLPPLAPVKYSTGPLIVPQGYAAVITGIRQWVGDPTAVQKPDGSPDDISWRVSAGGTAIFGFGNLPIMISSLEEEGQLFAIANESTPIQLSVKNNLNPSDPAARSIPIQALITGHWFPVDELDDIFRNR